MLDLIKITPFLFYHPTEHYAVADIREGEATHAEPQEGKFIVELSQKEKPLRVVFNAQTDEELLNAYIKENFPGVVKVDNGGLFDDIEAMFDALAQVAIGDLDAMNEEINSDPARHYTKPQIV